MDTTGISAALDRIRETQFAHGDLLRDHADLLRQMLAEQARTGAAIRNISRSTSQDKGSSPQETSLESSKLTAKAVLQWVAAVVAVTWVLRGGEPETLLKHLLPLLTSGLP